MLRNPPVADSAKLFNVRVTFGEQVSMIPISAVSIAGRVRIMMRTATGRAHLFSGVKRFRARILKFFPNPILGTPFFAAFRVHRVP